MYDVSLMYQRKSTRSYDKTPLEEGVLSAINEYTKKLVPLFPTAHVQSIQIPNENVHSVLPWKAPHYLAIFSEKHPDALINVGFMYQQMDLYLQSLGLGSCWLGMGRYTPSDRGPILPSGLSFTIMIAFGKPTPSPHRKLSEFKRKPLAQISDHPDPRLEPARLAPSSLNSQPWHFLHTENAIDCYCHNAGLLTTKAPKATNLIDMGIALGQLYMANQKDFTFFKREAHSTLKNHTYIGTITLGED